MRSPKWFSWDKPHNVSGAVFFLQALEENQFSCSFFLASKVGLDSLVWGPLPLPASAKGVFLTLLHSHFVSAASFHLSRLRTSWIHWDHLEIPDYAEVSLLTKLIPSATLMPLCRGTNSRKYKENTFWELLLCLL